jgi:copper chaperone CopZ
VDGVETAHVDLNAGTARIETESVSAQQLIAAVVEEGYGATLLD